MNQRENPNRLALSSCLRDVLAAGQLHRDRPRDRVEVRAVLLHGREVAVAEHLGVRVAGQDVEHEAHRGGLLDVRAGVLGFQVGRDAAHIRDADGVGVVALDMGAEHVLGAARFYGAVQEHEVVVADADEAAHAVHPVDGRNVLVATLGWLGGLAIATRDIWSVRRPLIAVPESYPEAALRHSADADRLAANRHFDGAGYLIGYAVECAIKSAIQASRPDAGTPHVHLPHLIERAKKAIGGRRRSAVFTVLEQAGFMRGWTVDARYRCSGTVDETQFLQWRNDANRMLGAVQLRRQIR